MASVKENCADTKQNIRSWVNECARLHKFTIFIRKKDAGLWKIDFGTDLKAL